MCVLFYFINKIIYKKKQIKINEQVRIEVTELL
jgi:hypothetical protein